MTTRFLSPFLHRLYDTTLDYFINVSTPCSPSSPPAGVRLEVGVFASLCQYFSESEKQWRTDGMVPLAETNASRAVCRTRHLTAFAAGLFVPADAISFKVPVSVTETETVFLHQVSAPDEVTLCLCPVGAFWCTKSGRALGVCVGPTELRRGSGPLAQVGPVGSTPGWRGPTLWPRRTLQVRGPDQDRLEPRGR